MLSPGLPTATPTHTTTDCQKKDSLDLNNPSNLPPPQIREQIYQNARQKKPCHDLLPSVQILAKTRRHALTMHSSFSSHTLYREIYESQLGKIETKPAAGQANGGAL